MSKVVAFNVNSVKLKSRGKRLDGSKVMMFSVIWEHKTTFVEHLSSTVCNSGSIRATSLAQLALLLDFEGAEGWCCCCVN
jgi:hypothetical protein